MILLSETSEVDELLRDSGTRLHLVRLIGGRAANDNLPILKL